MSIAQSRPRIQPQTGRWLFQEESQADVLSQGVIHALFEPADISGSHPVIPAETPILVSRRNFVDVIPPDPHGCFIVGHYYSASLNTRAISSFKLSLSPSGWSSPTRLVAPGRLFFICSMVCFKSLFSFCEFSNRVSSRS